MDGLSRARWVAWSTVLSLLVGTAAALSGAVALMPRAEEAVATPVSAEQLMVEGDRRFAAGDFKGALQAYDEALLLDRTDLGLYYRAGAALSHLGNREQTITLFLWVVRLGSPDREDVRRARAWLEAARVLPPPARQATSRR
ncbi:MAG: hypothetical protein ACREM3_13265 [Candidatus Rokuibacteriota bacterium]